jgi:signal transduction histidine kinase
MVLKYKETLAIDQKTGPLTDYEAPLRPGEKWRATARTGLLFALPLALAALLGALALDADYVVLRDGARRDTARVAEAFSGAAANEVTELAAFAFANIDRAYEAANPPQTLWRVIHGYDLGLLVLRRRGDRVVFPPEDPLAMPQVWEEKLRALTDVADLLRDGDFVNGWFPNSAGEYYFECHRRQVPPERGGAAPEREEVCIGLSSAQIFPTLFGVLDEFAAVTPGWSFRLRDPFDRLVWSKGDASGPFEAFTQSEALHGWVVELSGAPNPRRGTLGRLALALPLALVWLLLIFQARRAQNVLARESAARMALATRLSHDLRTPLANLKLYAELIRRKGGDNPDLARYCTVLTDEIDRLDTLAGDTIFQSETAPPVLRESADAGELARRIVGRYQRLLDAAHCSCDVRGAVEGPLVFDVRAFERILINLLDNARKYAPGRIEVAVDFDGKLLALSVRDHGGVSEAPLKSHGLGLSIVQELARANGGGFSLAGANPGLIARVTLKADRP